MVTKSITLKWIGPMTILEAIEDPRTLRPGVYCILRKHGAKIDLAYIGKSGRNTIKSRLQAHVKTKVKNHINSMPVLFAEVNPDKYDDFDVFVDDIESMLIYHTDPGVNKDKRQNLKVHGDYNIIIKNQNFSVDKMPASLNKDKMIIDAKLHPKQPLKKKKQEDDFPFSCWFE